MSEIKKVMEKMHELETLLEEEVQTPAPSEPATPFATDERPRRNTINSSSKERLEYTNPKEVKSALADLESIISSRTHQLKSLQKSEGKRRQTTTDISVHYAARNLDRDLSSVDTTVHTTKSVFTFESRTDGAPGTVKPTNLLNDYEGKPEVSPRSNVPENPFKNIIQTPTSSNHRAMIGKDFPTDFPPVHLSPSKPGGEMGSSVSLATDESVESINDANPLSLSPHTITVDNVQDHMAIREATVRFGQSEYKLSNLVIDSEEDVGESTDIVNASMTGEHDHKTTPHHTQTQMMHSSNVQDELMKEQQSFLRHSSGYQLPRYNSTTTTNHLTPDHSHPHAAANGNHDSRGSNSSNSGSSHIPSGGTSFYTNSSYNTNLNPNLNNLNSSTNNPNASMLNINFANEMDVRILRRHLNVYMLKNALLKEEVKQITTVTEEKVREILSRVERMEGERERWRADSVRAKEELLTEREELLFIRGQLQSKSARVVDLEAELLASQRYASALQREITVWRSTPSTPQQGGGGGQSNNHSTISATSISRIHFTSSSHHHTFSRNIGGESGGDGRDLSPYEAILMLIESAPHDKEVLMNYIRDLHREKHALETTVAELELHLEQMEHEHRNLLRKQECSRNAAASREEMEKLRVNIAELTQERDQLRAMLEEQTTDRENLHLEIDQLRLEIKEKDDALLDLELQHATLEERLETLTTTATNNDNDNGSNKKMTVEVVAKKGMIASMSGKKLSIIQEPGWTRLLCLLFIFQLIFWIMLLICARLYFQVALLTDNQALLRGVYRLRLTS